METQQFHLVRAYVGDPIKWKLINAGIKETHVFHFHNHQWRLETHDQKSTLIDSISFSPQQCIEFTPVFGAGSLTKTIGDVIWHCHLYPHFMQGMWGLLRILDRLEDGTRILPDGSISPGLVPLPDREVPPEIDEMHPGYPNFILGETGQKPTKPPLGIIGEESRQPTDLEEANFIEAYAPGELYSKTFKPGAPTRVFEIVAIQLPIIYNRHGWYDPEGRIFILKEDKEDILAGRKEIEPLVIRANAGENIEVKFTNELPESIGPNAFQIKTETTEAGYHIHLVKFDTIPSDGSANGYCNSASAIPNDTLIERFYADSELKTVFFHDHLFPNAHQQHGLFGAIIIEPPESEYYCNKCGIRIEEGEEEVIISNPEKTFREMVLFMQNGLALYNKHGKLIDLKHEGHQEGEEEENLDTEDQGQKGFNYRSERYENRLKMHNDLSSVMDSCIHGDPATPLFKAYVGDKVKIRLIMPADKPRNVGFVIHGHSWRQQDTDPLSPIVSTAGAISVGNVFNYTLKNGANCLPGDYCYRSGSFRWDVEQGMWGIFRVYDEEQDDLYRL